MIDIDLTHYARRVTLPASALAVIAIPVYGGHLPPLAAERLRGLQGYDTPAVAVVVYGNRAYENALTELAALAGAAGLNVIAAATFVGEHSYSSDRWPIAAGRPDADDLALAAEFGGRVAGKLQDTARGGRTDTIDVSRISRPRQPLLPLLRFIAGVIRLRRGKAAAAHAAAERPAQLYALRSVRHALLPERRHCPRRRKTYRRYEMYPVLRMRKVMPLARTHLRHPVRIAAQQMLQAPQSTPDNTVTKRNSIRRCRRQRP